VYGSYAGNGTLSTATLAKSLRTDTRFKEILGMELGAITIFPTTGATVGHCGVVGKAFVMSNNSKRGIWEANYSLSAWKQAAKLRGLPVLYFRPIAKVEY
jgi:hypothetical protein